MLKQDPYEKLLQMGLTLPPPIDPVANFAPYRQEGKFLFLSGQGPWTADGRPCSGKVGGSVSLEEARTHARQIGLLLLSVAEQATGDLRHVKWVVKLFGMVNATPDFTDHPSVIDGCSELFVELLGKDGIHARSAVGVGSLPFNFTVEIEAILALD